MKYSGSLIGAEEKTNQGPRSSVGTGIRGEVQTGPRDIAVHSTFHLNRTSYAYRSI